MPMIYNFEEKQPPELNEKMLRERLKHRDLCRQTLILRIAAVLVSLCYILFAFCIAPESMALAVVSILVAYVTIVGKGVISIVFYKKGACLE